MDEKCLNCEVYKEMKESNVPCICAWYMDNVILGDDIVDNCIEYRSLK